jgi:hypothetical protein
MKRTLFILILYEIICCRINQGLIGGAVEVGRALQAANSLEFFIGIILPAAL